MNPAEDLPDEVRTRAYYAQPVWKRITVIAAGPAMNLLLAFVLLFAFFFLVGRETATTDVGELERGFPAAGCAAERRQAGGGGRRAAATRAHCPTASTRTAAPGAERSAGLRGRRAGHRDRGARRRAPNASS